MGARGPSLVLARLLACFVKVALQLAQVRHCLHAAEPAPAVGGVEERTHEAQACARVREREERPRAQREQRAQHQRAPAAHPRRGGRGLLLGRLELGSRQLLALALALSPSPVSTRAFLLYGSYKTIVNSTDDPCVMR